MVLRIFFNQIGNKLPNSRVVKEKGEIEFIYYDYHLENGKHALGYNIALHATGILLLCHGVCK